MSEHAANNEDVLDLHRRLVSIPSLSHDEGKAADCLENYFRLSGLARSRIEDNVVVTIGDGPNTLLLNSHLDVVPPSIDHPFPPFEPTLRSGKVFGRGTVDAKASVACMASAMCRLHKRGFAPSNGRVLGAFTVCEETGGVDNGLERILPELPEITSALIGEPTCMQPCVSQKGLLILRLEAQGKSAHAARAEEGENAIARMTRDMVKLEKFRFSREHPFLGETSLSITMIEGGTARNMIPDHCTAYLDIRTTPAYEHDEIAALLDDILESGVHIHSKRFVSTDTPLHTQIVKACLKGNPGSEPFGSPTMSDWIHVGHLPVVKIGPGDSRLSHTGRENIAEAELMDGVAIYEAIITEYFAEGHRAPVELK